MTNTPLDSPTGFAPGENDRPAGTWMEGYWAQTAPWAKALAYATCTYYGWLLFQQFNNIAEMPDKTAGAFLLGASVLLYAPMLFMGYFGFSFGQNLQMALRSRSQILLEKAFLNLHRFVIAALVMACLWVLYTTITWYSLVPLLDYNGPNPNDGQPYFHE